MRDPYILGSEQIAPGSRRTIDLLGNVVDLFSERYLKQLEADRERCDDLLDRSLALVTALVPVIGYEHASEVAKEALETGRPVRRIVLDRGLLDEARLEELLSPAAMTEPRRLV